MAFGMSSERFLRELRASPGISRPSSPPLAPEHRLPCICSAKPWNRPARGRSGRSQPPRLLKQRSFSNSPHSDLHGLNERVWTPPLMQAVFGRLGACGQVLSCVRPLYAADDTPRARREIRGLGPNRLRELESSPFGCWFSQPGLVYLCPYLSSVLPTSPTASRTSPLSQAVAGAR